MAKIQIRQEGCYSQIDVDGVPLKGVVEANVRMEGGSLPVLEVRLFASEHGLDFQDGVLKVGALHAPEALERALLTHLKTKYEAHLLALPVVSMDHATGPDQTAVAAMADGKITIINNIGRAGEEIIAALKDPASSVSEVMEQAIGRNLTRYR